MQQTVRILVCDDHALLRTGLRRLLDSEPDFAVVGEAATAAAAVENAAALAPDVVILDVFLPDRSGIDALPDLLARSPRTKVLVLSMHDDPGYVRRAFAAGAAGYLLKEAAPEELAEAVREVGAGRRYLHPELGARLAADAPAGRSADSKPLSRRESEVMQLLALGYTNQEIAAELGISVRTAETHRAHVMRKLGLSTRAEIVRFALATGRLGLDQRAVA